jgi:hypothetical protein
VKISRLALRGVAGLPDVERDFTASSGRPHDLIVVAGPAASGKTRFCEVILAALEAVGGYHGIVHASDWYADAARGARAELGVWLEDGPEDREAGEPSARGAVSTSQVAVDFSARGVHSTVDRAVRRQLARYDHDPAHGKREYFPESRQRAWGARTDGLGVPEQSLLRSGKDPQKYSFVPRFLAELRTRADRRRAFAARLEALSPTVRHVPAARGGDPTACFANQTRIGVPYEQLSSSEADAVMIAATAVLIGLDHSLVVLDRPELYVPSERLGGWVQALLQLGSNNQWIVATSDATLASSVERSQLIDLGESGRDGTSSPRGSSAGTRSAS